MLPIEQGNSPFNRIRQLCKKAVFSSVGCLCGPQAGLQEVNVAAKEVLSGDQELRSRSSF